MSKPLKESTSPPQKGVPNLASAAPRRNRAGSVGQAGDRFFRNLVLGFGSVSILLAVAFAVGLIWNSRFVWREMGPAFLWSSNWDPVAEIFGALPFIYGTLVSSALALLIAVPLGLGAAIFLAEMAPRKISNALSFLIELLAAIPSVVLGLMGIFILVPIVARIEPSITNVLGWLPFFRGAPYGVGMLTAGIILAFMILPYITSVSREVILTVPRSQKEGALALGATRWEVVQTVVLPYARSGILGSIFLALGRALGETMAVTMVIGNTPQISASILDPAYSMAAVIANEFAEATSTNYVHALVGVALLLFIITFCVNAAARWMIHRLTLQKAA